jgi:hypothetical protein
MRRRFFVSKLKTADPITSKAYVYYPFNGDLKDYSGN